jgi:hypothetical protein
MEARYPLPMKAKKPTRVLEGIVRSVGGGSSGGGMWDLVVFLSPWREAEGPLVKKEVRLIVPVGREAALRRVMARHEKGAAIALAVSEISRKKGYPWWDAFGSGPIRAADPTPFKAEVKRQAKARTVEDETLGRLQLDRGMGWYEGTRRLGRKSYSVAVSTPDPDDEKKVARKVAAAGPRVVAVEREWSSILNDIAGELLDTYNEVWRQSGKPLSATAFKKLLAPSELHVADGRTTVYLSSGKLFADHGVEVRIPHRGKRRETLIS